MRSRDLGSSGDSVGGMTGLGTYAAHGARADVGKIGVTVDTAIDITLIDRPHWKPSDNMFHCTIFSPSREQKNLNMVIRYISAWLPYIHIEKFRLKHSKAERIIVGVNIFWYLTVVFPKEWVPIPGGSRDDFGWVAFKVAILKKIVPLLFTTKNVLR